MIEWIVLPDYSRLMEAAAEHFVKAAVESIDRRGRFSVALSGGSTPLGLYTLLSAPELVRSLNWSKTHCFWSDERCVPPDHPDSNYRMAKQVLLDRVPVPEENIHRIPGELGFEKAAAEYEYELLSFFDSDNHSLKSPSFDLILLGMGEDGHTASLFPGSPTLEIQDRWMAGVEHQGPPDPQVNRVSLTFKAINAAHQVIFLVSGERKAETLAMVMYPDPNLPLLPAARVAPQSGKLLWLVDQAAAELIRGSTKS
jgi:6-phosphogluconolactonase